MNSFETDFKRAITSWRFWAAVFLETGILYAAGGFESDLFRISVPVLCTLPYTDAWLLDYQSGFLKLYLPRTGVPAYVLGKISACAISGGAVEILAGWVYLNFLAKEEIQQNLLLLFMSGVFWAVAAAALAALANSRYLAYGGAFVIYYLLVILYERYFGNIYCLYPYEWMRPKHVWVFGEQGIVLLLAGLTFIVGGVYCEFLGRCIENV